MLEYKQKTAKLAVASYTTKEAVMYKIRMLLIWLAASCVAIPMSASVFSAPDSGNKITHPHKKHKKGRVRKAVHRPTLLERLTAIRRQYGPCGDTTGLGYKVEVRGDECYWDGAREWRDHPECVVVHHTKSLPNETTLWDISDWQRRGIYKRRPSSGHFFYKGGKLEEYFGVYNWVVMPDGEPIHVLPDTALSLNSHNKEFNKRCIAVVMVGDYRKKAPPPAMYRGLREVLGLYQYSAIYTHKAIKGHGETCPGPDISRWVARYVAERKRELGN